MVSAAATAATPLPLGTLPWSSPLCPLVILPGLSAGTEVDRLLLLLAKGLLERERNVVVDDDIAADVDLAASVFCCWPPLAPLSSEDLELGLPTLAALVDEAEAAAGATVGESSSSALPSFSKSALALLNLVWWLSVRVTGLLATLALSSSFLDSEP